MGSSTDDSTKGDIVIDLSSIGFAKTAPTEQNVHGHATAMFISAIDKILNNISEKQEKAHDESTLECINRLSCKLNSYYDREHQAIARLRTRGSGKTTFIINVIRKATEKWRLCNLGVIDPTFDNKQGSMFCFRL